MHCRGVYSGRVEYEEVIAALGRRAQIVVPVDLTGEAAQSGRFIRRELRRKAQEFQLRSNPSFSQMVFCEITKARHANALRTHKAGL